MTIRTWKVQPAKVYFWDFDLLLSWLKPPSELFCPAQSGLSCLTDLCWSVASLQSPALILILPPPYSAPDICSSGSAAILGLLIPSSCFLQSQAQLLLPASQPPRGKSSVLPFNCLVSSGSFCPRSLALYNCPLMYDLGSPSFQHLTPPSPASFNCLTQQCVCLPATAHLARLAPNPISVLNIWIYSTFLFRIAVY